MVAVSKNFRAKRKQGRTRSAILARCPVVLAALGEECGWEGNFNRIPIGCSYKIEDFGIHASNPIVGSIPHRDFGIHASTQIYAEE